jgi:NADH:ubiquinone oxidoreductase subunit 6 (subunit J)
MKTAKVRFLPAALVAVLFIGIASVVLESPSVSDMPAGIEGTTTNLIGNVLFDDFLAVFELVAVLLVAALIGGVYLAKPEESRGDAVREAVDMKPRVETEEVNDGSD